MLSRFLPKKSWCEKIKGVEVLSGHQGSIRSCDISSDGALGATCSGDNSVIVWDLTQKRIKFLLGANSKKARHTHIVTAVTFSPCGSFLASSSWDRTIRIWDVNDGNLLATILAHEKVMTCCHWLPDGRAIVSGSSDGTVRLWRLFENDCDDFSQFSWGSGEPVEFAFKFSGAGYQEDLHSQDAARFFEITGHHRRPLEHLRCCVASVSPFDDCSGSVAAFAVSSDSKRVAAVSPSGALVVLDAQRMTEQEHSHAALLKVKDACVGASSVSWTECGDLLAIGSRETNVQIRSGCTGDLLVELDVRGSFVAFLRGCVCMDCLLISGSLSSKTMHVWKVGAPCTAVLQVSSKATTAVVVKASGQLMAGRDDSSIMYLRDVYPAVCKALMPKRKLKRASSNTESDVATNDVATDRLSDTITSGTTTIDSAGEVEKLQSVLAEQQAINVQLQAAISQLSQRMGRYETTTSPTSPPVSVASDHFAGVVPAPRSVCSAPSTPLLCASPADCSSAGSVNPLHRPQPHSTSSMSTIATPPALLRHASEGSWGAPRLLEPELSLAPDLCASSSHRIAPEMLEAQDSMAPDLCSGPRRSSRSSDPGTHTRPDAVEAVAVSRGAEKEGRHGGGVSSSNGKVIAKEAVMNGPRISTLPGQAKTEPRFGQGGNVPLAVKATLGSEEAAVDTLRAGLVVTRQQHVVTLAEGVVVARGQGRESDVHRDARDHARCVAVHPNGSVVAVGGQRCIRLWNSEAEQTDKMLGHGLVGKGVEAVAFSTSGRWLACVAEKEAPKVLLWDWAQGSLLCMRLAHKEPSAVRCLHFCPQDETRFVTAGRQHFKVWRVQHDPRPVEGGPEVNGEDHLILTSRRGVFCCGAVPDVVSCVAYGSGGALYLGTLCGAIMVCSEHLALRRIPAHDGPVWALALTENGGLLSGGADKTVREWRAFEEREEASETHARDVIVALASTVDGRVLMLGAGTGNVPQALLAGRKPEAEDEPAACFEFKARGTTASNEGVVQG